MSRTPQVFPIPVAAAIRSYVVGMACTERGGAHAAALASDLDVTEKHARTLLFCHVPLSWRRGHHDAEEVLNLPSLPHNARHVWLPSPMPSRPEVTKCWDDWCLFVDGQGRRSPTSRLDAALRAVSDALRIGDLARAERLISRPPLGASPQARVTARHRKSIAEKYWHHLAQLRMQQGRHREALSATSRALSFVGHAESECAILAVMGAALRMRSTQGCADSIDCFSTAITRAGAIVPDVRRAHLRRLHCGITAPLIVRGRVRETFRHLDAAWDLCETPDELVETALCFARTHFHAGDQAKSESYWQRANLSAPRTQWLRGWLMRFRICFASEMLSKDDWNAIAHAAWSENAGFNFQRALLLHRLASSGSFAPLEWPVEVQAEIRQFLSIPAAALAPLTSESLKHELKWRSAQVPVFYAT